jgi:hypothetical protein
MAEHGPRPMIKSPLLTKAQLKQLEQYASPVKLRSDLRVPVITIITETDLIGSGILGFYGARQPDNGRLRVWEIPGTAHADNYAFTVGHMDSGSVPLEKLETANEPTANALGGKSAKPVNNALQHHYVVETALWNLDRWIRTGQRAEVTVGQPVTFTAKIEVPPQTGRVVAAGWDFEGTGNYPDIEKLIDFNPTLILKVTHTFSKPGTYFPMPRATSQRDGDSKTTYARVQNLARVRVVVK